MLEDTSSKRSAFAESGFANLSAKARARITGVISSSESSPLRETDNRVPVYTIAKARAKMERKEK